MNNQNQWLFEAPFASAKIPYPNFHPHLEYYSNLELSEDCGNRTSDCPSNGTPSITISGYSTHESKIPRGEQEKIQIVAERIITSAKLGSQSIRVCIVGHADLDQRGKKFEKDISRQRAEAVREALRLAINDQSVWSKVKLQLFCAGKDNPVVAFNKPLVQRARNRRVEIFLLTPGTPNSCIDQCKLDFLRCLESPSSRDECRKRHRVCLRDCGGRPV